MHPRVYPVQNLVVQIFIHIKHKSVQNSIKRNVDFFIVTNFELKCLIQSTKNFRYYKSNNFNGIQ